MFLSDEIRNEALSLKEEKNSKYSLETRLIKFCVSKMEKMSNGDYSNGNSINVLRCINNSYKEACKSLSFLDKDAFKHVIEGLLSDKGIKIKL